MKAAVGLCCSKCSLRRVLKSMGFQRCNDGKNFVTECSNYLATTTVFLRLCIISKIRWYSSDTPFRLNLG
jgi:hypothetical protein